MAVNWLWKNKMGKLTLTNRDGKNYGVNIYAGNCLAVFIYEYKNEVGEDWYDFYGFFNDKAHAKRCLKKEGRKVEYCGVPIAKIELNLYWDESRTLLNMLTRMGVKVTCYYKEIKD